MRILIVDDRRALALNAACLPEGCEAIAINFELPADGSAPEWVELIPGGRSIQGRDGRLFVNDHPEAILDFFRLDGRDVPIDWEHATEIRAPKGEPAPAAGWIKQLEIREGGSVWGRPVWNAGGKASLESKEYRYLSPAIIVEKETGRIRGLSSVGLVNKPNFRLNALNSQQTPTEEEVMNLKALLAKLGLPETATLEEALNAIGKLQGDLQTALNRANTPSLDLFVPRGDYDAALLRATNAEQKVKDKEKAELEAAINAEVDAALKAGKIVPATKEFYLASCRQEGGLEQFRKFVAAAPVIGAASDLDGKRPPEGGLALNAEQQKVAGMFGNSAEDLKKYGQA
jgi:phage I-like protein